MKQILILSILTISLYACSTTQKRGAVTYNEGGAIKSGQGKLYCDKPRKNYATELDAKVKGELSSLSTSPANLIEAGLTQKVVELSDYSSSGLDLDLLLFRICEMSINRGFSEETTKNLIELAIKTWDTEKKKKQY
ncbi:MAG: hypothetical protein KIT62_10080 [Cyclobacteriaceae bacterium]|nr:hypothetical protein [Cyclobacteriaceae bacterium]